MEVWENIEAAEGRVLKQITPPSWQPQNYNQYACKYCDSEMEWPDMLSIDSIGPAPKGTIWGDMADVTPIPLENLLLIGFDL